MKHVYNLYDFIWSSVHASQTPEKGTNETRTLYQQFHPQKAGQQRKTRAGPTLARYHKYHAIPTVYTLW